MEETELCSTGHGQNGILLIGRGVAYHKTKETDLCWSVGGNDTYGITRIPTTVAGRGVVRRVDQTDSTRFVYPGSGREDA